MTPKAAPAAVQAATHADLVAGLTGADVTAERALALRTRRAVYKAAVERRVDHDHQRRHLILALLITAALVFALAPELWDGIEGLLGGEDLLDLPGMLIALGMALFAAVAAVLFLLGGNQQQVRHSRR